MSKLLDLFRTKKPDKPMDLSNFEDSRDRLHESAKSAAKELDAFADMVLGMRETLQPRRKRSVKKRR